MSFFKLEKIIWAVDPFAEPKDLQMSAAWAIRALSKSSHASVEPVYLFGVDFQKILDEIPGDFQKEVLASAQDEMKEILNRVQIPNIKPLHILSVTQPSLRERVRGLLDYTEESSSNLIVLSTHARKGLKRLLVGSFAETMILYSNIPMLVVNPSWNHVPQFEHILFPTDFSNETLSVFEYVLDLAKSLKSKITLFHKIQPPWLPFTDIPFSNVTFFKELLQNEIEARQVDAQKFQDLAKPRGINVSLHVDYDPIGPIEDAILAYSQKEPSLIVMAANSDPKAASFLGSVREIL